MKIECNDVGYEIPIYNDKPIVIEFGVTKITINNGSEVIFINPFDGKKMYAIYSNSHIKITIDDEEFINHDVDLPDEDSGMQGLGALFG